MADRVSHQMGQRLGQGIQQAFVQIGFMTAGFQVHLLCRIAWPRHAPCGGSGGKAARPAPCGFSSPSVADRLSTRAWKPRASAKRPRSGSLGLRRTNSCTVCCSIDLPIISSPTRFNTASMRSASTRKMLSGASSEPVSLVFQLDSAGRRGTDSDFAPPLTGGDFGFRNDRGYVCTACSCASAL